MSSGPGHRQPRHQQRPAPRHQARDPAAMVLNVVLALIAIFWLVPDHQPAGRSRSAPSSSYGVSGWWTVFTAPAQLTLQNYKALFSTGLRHRGLLDSVITTALITVPATLLVTAISSLAAYSLVFGRWRGRTFVFLLIVGLMVVPVQVALIPVAQLYDAFVNLTGLHAYATLPGVVIFHVAFGLPFGIFLMRNFYTGIPQGPARGGPDRRRRRMDPLPARDPPPRSAGGRVAGDLPVHLGVERPPGRPGLPGRQRRTTPSPSTSSASPGPSPTTTGSIATGGIISILVPLAIFFAFQRYFVRGVLAGAVK